MLFVDAEILPHARTVIACFSYSQEAETLLSRVNQILVRPAADQTGGPQRGYAL